MEVDEDFSENKPCASEQASTNITADEIDQETANKLRGSAIGDTLYSEVFVLNTLMQFSELKWSKSVEDDLCFLWDMTEEQDVRQYLFQISYPALACTAIQNHDEPRFIEIVVGIFANLLCPPSENHVKNEEIRTVINLLNSNDPYILIQVMRFIHALAFISDKLDLIEAEHLDRFDYILSNSANKELLSITLKALSAVTENLKINENTVKGKFLMSAVTAYRTLKDDCETEFEMFECKEKHLNVKHLIQLACNLCSYIDVSNISRLVDEINDNLLEFTNEVVLLLNYYKIEDNLLPLDDDFRFYIEALAYVYRILQVEYISSLAKLLYEIFSIICKKNSDNIELVAELLCYFISVGNLDTFKQDFADATPDEVKDVLSRIEKGNFKFEFEYMINLRLILNEL